MWNEETVYNINIKLEYLMQKYKTTDIEEIKNTPYWLLFVATKSYEALKGRDLSTFSNEELIECLNQQLNHASRYVYFRDNYMKAVSYINAVNKDITIQPISSRIMYDGMFKNNDEILLDTPDKLYGFLSKRFYSLDQELTSEHLIIAYLMLLYFGIKKNEICSITIDNIKFSDINCKISVGKRQYLIVGETVELIKRIALTREIKVIRELTITVKQLSLNYLMMYDGESPGSDAKVRMRRYDNKYHLDCKKYPGAYPYINDIEFSGTIYHIQNKYIECPSDAEVLKAYEEFAGTVKNANKRIEIIKRVKRKWN